MSSSRKRSRVATAGSLGRLRRLVELAAGFAGSRAGRAPIFLVKVGCPDILRAHRRSRRAYAHQGHGTSYLICVHPRLAGLSDGFALGILLHEIGHVATPGGTEQDADRWVFERLGIAITYRGPLRLEWVDPSKIR